MEQYSQDHGPYVKKDYSEVEDVARFNNVTFLTTAGETHLNSQGAFTDSGFLSMFNFPMLQGDPVHALNGPYSIVLTKHLAITLFGNADPMGRTVRIDSNANFTVTGVMKDLPDNTSFNFNYLLPWSFMTRLGWEDLDWGRNSVYSYVLLKPGASQAAFDEKIRNITRSHSKETPEVITQSMERFHLYARSENGRLVGDRINTVRLFGIIAGFILLIACINFMNLSTARSERRAKEVGIRKVVGAYKGYLVAQFIGESILISIISFAIAVFIVQVSLPPFNQLVGKQLFIDYYNPWFWTFSIGFILFTGLLAGSYPAFYLSSFRPAQVLKGAFKATNALVTPRKALVVVQFSFAIVLIISTLIIGRQIQYGQDRNAGYERTNMVYAFTQGDVDKHYKLIKTELLSSGAAVGVTRTSGPITRHWSDGWGFSWDGSTETDKKTDFIQMSADADFTLTTGVKILQGRDIDINKFPTDSSAMLVNEAALVAMHVKNPIGITVKQDDGPTWHVVGVIRDFILESPFEQKDQSDVHYGGPQDLRPGNALPVLNPANTTATNLALAEKVFHKYNPSYPFEYYFSSTESYARSFRDELRIGRLAALFAGLTIFISCLGLFALATYMAENRVKEIGVRKVLGASVTGLTALLAKDFIKLVLAAFIIATPIAWFAMDKWLKGFGYRIEIGWGVFAVSGALAIMIALLTVSYQAIKAAIANPIRSLRSE